MQQKNDLFSANPITPSLLTQTSNKQSNAYIHEYHQLEYMKNKIDYIIGARIWKRSLTEIKMWAGADCEINHEILMCKFQMKLRLRSRS